jgi:hypothetical protein
MSTVSPRVGAAAIVLPVVAGLLAAVAFMVLPLGSLNTRGGQAGSCGPGGQAGNAIQILLHPEAVNQDANGTQSSATADNEAFKSLCKDEANGRFEDAVISIGSGIVLAVVFLLILQTGHRPHLDPVPPYRP